MDSLENVQNNPPSPPELPTHPLEIINYQRLLASDAAEIEKLWNACRTLGFFYLANHGIDNKDAFDIGKASLRNLPLDEKKQFHHDAKAGKSFGYKPPGANLTNAEGGVDTVEWWNIAKDDILSHPTVAYRSYAPPIIIT